MNVHISSSALRKIISGFRPLKLAGIGGALLSLTMCAATGFGQESGPTAAPFTPYSNLSKQEKKERLKQPPYIQIGASTERVKSLFIQSMSANGFFLSDSSSNALTFTKRMNGVGATILAGLAGGSDMEWTLTLSIAEVDGISHVNARMFLSTQNTFGKRSYSDATTVSKQREGLDNILWSVKNFAER